MHSLPSRRRLPQPNFFRFKCDRLSPVPLPRRPPPPLPAPAPAPALPGLLPAAHVPVHTPPPVSAHAHTLAHAPAPPGAHDQTHTHAHTPGTVRQADARLHGAAVGRQGCRTFSQSANRDSVIQSTHVLHLHHCLFNE